VAPINLFDLRTQDRLFMSKTSERWQHFFSFNVDSAIEQKTIKAQMKRLIFIRATTTTVILIWINQQAKIILFWKNENCLGTIANHTVA
jgi:plasmid maintenance system killer protein